MSPTGVQFAEGAIFRGYLRQGRVLTMADLPLVDRDEYLGGLLVELYTVKPELIFPSALHCKSPGPHDKRAASSGPRQTPGRFAVDLNPVQLLYQKSRALRPHEINHKLDPRSQASGQWPAMMQLKTDIWAPADTVLARILRLES